MTEKEKQEALSRLAASEVLSLQDKQINSSKVQMAMDEFEAVLKIMRVLNVMADQAETVHQRLIDHLKQSDLTINFKAGEFFEVKPKGFYLNVFEKNRNGASYVATRDKVEENIFGYSKTDKKKTPKEVIDRAKQFGSFTDNTNPSFVPSIRPKYAALNFTRDQNGAASHYGRSYMVLKEHVKHNCTFTDKDSFAYGETRNVTSLVANYHHLDRLIVTMDSAKLKKLYNAATGGGSQSSSGVLSYIEAQVHGDIMFNRDVKKLYIAASEVTGPNDRRLREMIAKFTKKNGILLEYN
jgi:hypothetical protein